jgi:tetratricopeptide (TPR) repeat protein
MAVVTTTLSMPDWIVRGLLTNRYERVGGVVRDAQTKQVIMWLREAGGVDKLTSSTLGLLPTLGSAASILNLAVTSIGFAVVIKRLGDLERRLQQAQAALQHIGVMLDIGFYGNFRAALDLAINALTMANAKNREASAMQAIGRLAEARHHYTALTDTHLKQASQVVDEYLATLALAYITEARCYLELEEVDVAQRILGRGISEVDTRVRQYVQILLTSNPAVYLHPELRGMIDLRRLTHVLRWLDPALDENAVFEAQRQNLFAIARKPEEWIQRLPPAIWDPKVDQLAQGITVPGVGRINRLNWPIGWLGSGESLESRVVRRLPGAMLAMEALIEDVRRLQSYHAEAQAIRQLGMSFRDWQRLLPDYGTQGDGSGLIYLVLSEPLTIVGGTL